MENCLQYTTPEGGHQSNKFHLWGESNTVTAIDYETATTNFTVKLFFNNVVSTPGPKFLGLDLKDFYLNPPMDCPKFLQINLDNFPDNVINMYTLMEKVDAKGFAIIQLEKGIYELPYTGIIV